MKIGIVIPTYQEEQNIKKIHKSFQKIKNVKFMFCFVDGSYDNKTSKQIKKYFKKNYHIIKENKKEISFFNPSSRCEASLLGFKWFINNTQIKLIADMDADLASNPNDINKALKIYSDTKSDLIIGSKYLKNSKISKRKLIRAFCSKIYTQVCKILISSKIKDYSAGYRFYSRKSLKKLVKKKQRYKSPTQHLENLLFYYENNYKISEFPAIYIDSNKNSKSIKISHLLLFVCQLLNILLNFYLRKLK